MTRSVSCLALVAALAAVCPSAVGAEKKKGFFGVMIAQPKKDGPVVVMSVFPDSPADKGGLRAGDVLVEVGATKPVDLRATVALIGSLKPGEKVQVRVKRDGKEKELTVTVGER